MMLYKVMANYEGFSVPLMSKDGTPAVFESINDADIVATVCGEMYSGPTFSIVEAEVSLGGVSHRSIAATINALRALSKI